MESNDGTVEGNLSEAEVSEDEQKKSTVSQEEEDTQEEMNKEVKSNEDQDRFDYGHEPELEDITGLNEDAPLEETDEARVPGENTDNFQSMEAGNEVSPPTVEKETNNEEIEAPKEGEESEMDDEEDDEKFEHKEQENEDEEEQEGDENIEKNRKEEEDEHFIPVDFYYSFEELASKPVVAQDSGLPLNMLELKYSYGYDCKRRNNLHLLDENTIIFAAGNVVQILDLKTQTQRYLRSTSGCGIGAICVHPSRKYFAVGEKGDVPNINIFEFPSLKLYRILRGGTEQSYTSMTFSPDGELLATQGGEPDFMLTLWSWMMEKTTLRTKSFSQDVYRVSFARELEGQLTTAGSGHIRFWKMADTFTGLKLQGELGRFGRTEISDIEGYVELPDGKVLSGAEWGNLLLWDGGLIKVEITCKGRKHCHQGPIMQILLDEGELMTVGMDGYIKVWDSEAIDTADAVDESGIFEMDAMNELHVGPDVQLYSIVKSVDNENEPTIWYAQDANGGIWRLDLSFSHTSLVPEKLFTFHAGPITGCVSSPLTHLAVSSGLDTTVRVYDYIQMKQLAEAKFNSGGTTIEFVPLSVDSKGSSVVVGFEDGVVRALTLSRLDEEQIRRHEKHEEADIALKQAFKPHNKTVTALAFDGKGEILATGSLDGTVFFMYVSDVYDPIGFVKLPRPVRQLSWTPEKFKEMAVLVTCEDGIVVEIAAPKPGDFDTSHTYEIKGLAMRTYKFKSIKSHLRHEEELERLRIAELEIKRKEEEERKKRIERGLETESEHGDEEGEQKPKTPQREWHPFIPEEASPILNACYSQEEGRFWLSMGGFDAGYLYECKFTSPEEQADVLPDNIDKPLKAVPVQESGDIPIYVIRFSNSGQQVLFGMGNGQIRIQQLNEPWDLSELGPHWTISMHDNSYGYVTSVINSFDGAMLLSTGADGNFFQYSFMSQEELDGKIKENRAKLPSARKPALKIVDEIDDPNAYSIEDAKQKTEHDKRMKEAEHKKREAKKKINALRRQFRTIMERNENLPKHLQLSRMEFEMDKKIRLELEQQTERKKDLVRKELAWEAEKLQIGLDKIRKSFKDIVECERIVVKAFFTSHEVSSFRTPKLSDDFYLLRAEYERKKVKQQTLDDSSLDSTKEISSAQRKTLDTSGTAEDGTDGDVGSKFTTTLKGSAGERIKNALQKLEEKEKKRAGRKMQWEELYSCKPHDDYEDPEDVAAIKEAHVNMGDYKLKTAADYVVPDHLRMNVEKARGRLILLKDLIHGYKYDFNIRLLALREKKIKTIEKIQEIVNQLQEIHKKLDPEHHLQIPAVSEMHPDEVPERILNYTKESLKRFKIEYEQKKRQSHMMDGRGGVGGGGNTGGFGFGFGGNSGTGATSLTTSSDKQFSTLSTTITTKQSTTVSTTAESEDAAENGDEVKEEEETMSPIEKEIHYREQVKLVDTQKLLLQHIQDLITRFDAELRLLRHDKFIMEIVMKDADLRLVTLFEELVLLKDFSKTEDILAVKLSNKQQEKMDMQSKILEVQGKIDLKKKDIEKLQEKEKTLMGVFIQSLGENNKFADYLTKVFKHKVKRTKKRLTDGQESDEDSEDESSDDSDWEESDEESESEVGGYDLDICPPGCDQKLYDDTCMLREKRLDIEEALADEKKNHDGQKKDLENLQKRAKIIDGQLKTAEDELEDFQLEKQRKLNVLIVVATLKLHQIQHVVGDILPNDLSSLLVFESSEVVRLQHRIKELEHEKLLQKKHMRESRKKHVQLIKDRRLFEAKIGNMEETCSQMMVAKFGTIVDLEKIESVTVNRAMEELKEKMRNTEANCADELKIFNGEIAKRRDEITDMIRDNTKRLTQKATLLSEQNYYTNSLDNRQRKVGAEFKGQRKTDVNEKQRLIQLVQLQAQEMDALKEEIILLSRKGGHILPPAQPPLPQKASSFLTSAI